MYPDTHTPWWEADEHEVAQAVVSRAEQIRDSLAGRYERYRRAYRLYGEDPDNRDDDSDYAAAEVLHENLVAMYCESLASELTQGGIRVSITAVAGSFEEKLKAETSEWYADAAYVRHRLPLLHYQLELDAIISGIGIGVVVDTEDGPVPERVHPCDALLDDGGCSTVEPPEFGVLRRVSRHHLMQRYSRLADKLRDTPRMEGSAGRDVLEVVEFWYDAGKDKKGRHVAAIKGMDVPLFDDEWEGRPPSFYVRVVPSTKSMVGPSLALRAEAMQMEHDRINARLQDGGAARVPRTYIQQGTVEKDHLEDDMDTVVEVNGIPQQCVYEPTPAAVHPEVYKRLDDLRQAIARSIQSNDMFASGELPAGVRSGSGKAIKHYRENRSKRHAPAERERDWMAVQLIKELIRGEIRAAEDNEGHRVVVQMSGVTKRLPLSEMLVDEEQIQIQASPSSDLPLEAAVRIELLAELVQDGIISIDDFHSNSQVVDFKDAQRRATAPTRIIEMYIGQILRDGKVRQPPKHIDYQRALSISVERLALAELDEAPEARLRALRAWTDEIAARIAEQTAPAPMDAAALPPAAPMGAPVPPMDPMAMGGGMDPMGGPVPPPGMVPMGSA